MEKPGLCIIVILLLIIMIVRVYQASLIAGYEGAAETFTQMLVSALVVYVIADWNQ